MQVFQEPRAKVNVVGHFAKRTDERGGEGGEGVVGAGGLNALTLSLPKGARGSFFVPLHGGVRVLLCPFQVQEPLELDVNQRNVGIAGPGAGGVILDELFQVFRRQSPLVAVQLQPGGTAKGFGRVVARRVLQD